MTDRTSESLGTAIESLTRWDGGEVRVWERAIVAETKPRPVVSKPVWIAAAACIAFGLVVVAMVPRLQSARSVRYGVVEAAPAARLGGGANLGATEGFAGELPPPSDGLPLATAAGERVQPGGSRSEDAPLLERAIVRKATLELRTGDVRGAFMRASMLPNSATGEYVESSSLSGEGVSLSGSLTMRVEVARLGPVLIALRDLGTVASESASGDDVTDRIVDLDARLRNERRVEAELLELLGKRQDAPLTDILELRKQLAVVRDSIEMLVARRENMGRMVSLATVLVLVRSDAGAVESQSSSWFDPARSYMLAWRKGVRTLVEFSAWCVTVLVGGAPFWIAGAVGVVAIVRYRRHRARRAAHEPAPVG